MTDFYLLDEKLTAAERAVRDGLRDFCAREVTPIINGYWERAECSSTKSVSAIEGMSTSGYGLVKIMWEAAYPPWPPISICSTSA